LIATLIALAIMDPSIRTMIKMGRSGQADTPAFGKAASTVNMFGPILGILALTILVMMICKPGSGCGAAYRC
jgi:hypothetical protein